MKAINCTQRDIWFFTNRTHFIKTQNGQKKDSIIDWLNLHVHGDESHIIPDVDYLCLLCIDFYVWDAVSTFNHLPRMFLSTDFAFWITDWTCCHGPYLHAILRIISRGVSGLATDSPCGVWGRGWTTCLLHDSPLFGSHFKMRVGM